MSTKIDYLKYINLASMCEAKLNLAMELNSEFENWMESEEFLDLHDVF